MKRLYASFYLLAIATLALSVTICEILTVELYMTSTLTFKTASVKRKYTNGKAICHFIFVGKSNVCLSVTICDKFAIEMCMTLTLTFRMV